MNSSSHRDSQNIPLARIHEHCSACGMWETSCTWVVLLSPSRKKQVFIVYVGQFA